MKGFSKSRFSLNKWSIFMFLMGGNEKTASSYIINFYINMNISEHLIFFSPIWEQRRTPGHHLKVTVLHLFLPQGNWAVFHQLMINLTTIPNKIAQLLPEHVYKICKSNLSFASLLHPLFSFIIKHLRLRKDN